MMLGDLHRLSLDKDDIEAAGGRSADEVLLAASLSAKWGNADAIDTAVTAAVACGKKVRLPNPLASRMSVAPPCWLLLSALA